MVLSYKLPGEDSMQLPLELSATTEEVKEYVCERHDIAGRVNIRIYVQRKAVYLAPEKTLEESGVKADSTLGVLYADSAEKKRNRRHQAKETLVRKDIAAQGDRVISSQRQPNERLEAMAKIVVDGNLPLRTSEQTDAERLAQIRHQKNLLSTEEELLLEEKRKEYDPSLSPEENRAALANRHQEEKKMLKQQLAGAKRRRDEKPRPRKRRRAGGVGSPAIVPAPTAREKEHEEATGATHCEQAAIDYKAVADVVKEATAGNAWVKAADHWQRIADFLGHLVAVSYASTELVAKTPAGYNFLPPVAFPHPSGENRGRTALAKEIVVAMGPQVQHQVFALVIWRYHNTAEAWVQLRPSLTQFAADEDFGELRESIEAAYGDNPCKSYLFSTGDGIRSSAGAGSWRRAVLTSLEAWWSASQRAAELLLDTETTPDSWHSAFVHEIVPRLPCFGFDYWPKFIYGDIGHHVAPSKVDLQRYTIVGIGCRKLLESWGISLPKTGRAAQARGLEAVGELQQCVAAVFDSQQHKGIETARREAGLRPLTAYDVQVQCCECKRGRQLPGQIAKARVALYSEKDLSSEALGED